MSLGQHSQNSMEVKKKNYLEINNRLDINKDLNRAIGIGKILITILLFTCNTAFLFFFKSLINERLVGTENPWVIVILSSK